MTTGSEVRCEFANYVSKFGSWAGTSQLISEFNFNFRVLISHTKIINTRVTFEMAGEELTDFLRNIEEKIGKESCKIITNTLLKDNNFTSRLSLKLLSPENLDVLFAKSKLPLGSRKILDYHLELLRNESPLSRPKSQRTVCAQEENVSHSKVGLCFSTNSCKYESQQCVYFANMQHVL